MARSFVLRASKHSIWDRLETDLWRNNSDDQQSGSNKSMIRNPLLQIGCKTELTDTE